MYKKFICIALFLVMLASMSCISASDIAVDGEVLSNADEIEVQSAPADDLSTDDNSDALLSNSDADTGKLTPELDADIEIDDSYVNITCTVSENATGNISIEVINVNDENFTVTDTVEIENGTARWAEMISFNKGEYLAHINYLGDDNYSPKHTNRVFSISKFMADMNVDIAQDNEFVKITAILNTDATGNVTIRIKTFEEENYTEYATIELENGTATWADQVPFNKGNYVVYTTYTGDKKYFKAGDIRTFTVEKEIPEFNVTVTVDEYLIIMNATLPENATGNITIQIKTYDEENYTEYATVEVENGSAIWSDFIPFDKGDYMLSATYSGDENYFRAENTQTFTIEKQIPPFDVNITVDEYLIGLNATLPENATGNITIQIKTYDEENYTEYATIELENGTAAWTSKTPFNKGNYVVYTTYSGDDEYFKAGNTQTFTIDKEIPAFDINVTIDEYLVGMNATLPENATGNITIRIRTSDEENYTEYATVEVKNGKVEWDYPAAFNKGDYVLSATYNGDKNYFKAERSQAFTIEKQIPDMIIDATRNGTNITIQISLPENATGNVTLTNYNTGESKNVTLNGTSIEFNETLQDIYNMLMIEYSGDDYYFGLRTPIVEILKFETQLSVPKTASVVYANTVKITVKLDIVDAYGNITCDGEEVTITVNGKTYDGTLKNSTVTISIQASYADKFIPNNYTANVTFEGNDYLKNASASFVLVVKKGTPKLSASAKTFKVSTKTKKYTITLKNHKNNVMKNVKVTLKINGKTFKANTNSKGKATFKITNLKKRARYTAVVKYAGSKYYNAVSKKIKITAK